jgi:hypothetical protein
MRCQEKSDLLAMILAISGVLRKRPEITSYFQAKIPGEILQNEQSYFWTRP